MASLINWLIVYSLPTGARFRHSVVQLGRDAENRCTAHVTEALDSFTHTIHLDPARARAHLSLARVKASIGDVTGAIHEFHVVLQHDPNHAQVWFGLSDLNIARFSAAETRQLQRACAHNQPDSDADNLRGFALGKALEQQGHYADAFAAFQAANAACQSTQKSCPLPHSKSLAYRQLVAIWTPSKRRPHNEILYVK